MIPLEIPFDLLPLLPANQFFSDFVGAFAAWLSCLRGPVASPPWDRPSRVAAASSTVAVWLDRNPPLLGQAIEIAADAQLHGGTLEGIAEGGFCAIAFIGLIALTADIGLFNPVIADLDAQRADDIVIGQEMISILPAINAKDGIQPVLDGPRIDIGHGEARLPRMTWGFHLTS